MILVEIPYGGVCPNKNIKVKYDVCKKCGMYKSLLKTFVTCHLNSQSLQMTPETLEVKEVDLENEFNNFLDNIEGIPRMWHSNKQIEWAKSIAKHFFELGIRTRKEEVK